MRLAGNGYAADIVGRYARRADGLADRIVEGVDDVRRFQLDATTRREAIFQRARAGAKNRQPLVENRGLKFVLPKSMARIMLELVLAVNGGFNASITTIV